MANPLVEVVITGNNESLLSTFDSSAEAADDAASSLNAAAEEMSNSLNQPISAVGKLGTSFDDVSTGSDAAASAVASSAEDISGSLNGVNGTITDLQGHIDEIGSSFEGSFAQIDSGASQVSETIEGVQLKFAGIGEAAGATAAEVNASSLDITGSLTEVADAADVASAHITDLGLAAEPTEAEIDAASTDMVDSLTGVGTAAAAGIGSLSAATTAAVGDIQLLLAQTDVLMAKVDKDIEAADVALAGTGGAAAEAGTGVSKYGKIGFLALAGITAEAIHMGDEFDTATDQMAAQANMTAQHAQKIGDVFEATGGQFTSSGLAMVKAFTPVAAQLDSVNHGVYTTGEALQFMTAANYAAEGSSSSLSGVTGSLAKVMQAYGLQASGATNASNILFNAGQITGNGFTAVGNQIAKLRSKLGELAPNLAQTAGLLDDMTEHGETGRAAMTALSPIITSLLKPQQNLDKSIAETNQDMKLLPPNLQKLAEGYEQNKYSTTAWTSATAGLTTGQSALLSTFTSSYDGIQKNKTAIANMGLTVENSKGNFVGFNSIIGQLHNQIAGMPSVLATARLAQDGLGSSASKLLGAIEAGPSAFDKATSATDRAHSAQEAAAKATDNFKGMWDKLKTALENVETELGQKFIPVATKVVKVVLEGATALLKHKDILIAVAAVIGGTLITVMGLWIASMVRAAVISAATNAKQIVDDARLVASKIAAVASWVAANAVMIAGYVAQAAAATAAFIAENAATLGIGAAIAALVGIVIYLALHWKQTWKTIKEAAEAVWKFLDGDIIHPIEEAFDWLVKEIKAHWQVLTEILLAPFAPILAVVLAFHNQIANFFEDIPHYAMDAVNDVVGFFSAMPGEIMSGVGDLLSTIFGGLTSAGDWINDNVIEPVISYFTSLPGRIVSGLGNIVATIFHGLLSAGSWIWSNALEPALYDYFVRFPELAVSALGDVVGTIFHGLLAAGTWINTNVITPIVGFFKGLPHDIVEAIGDLGSIGENVVKGIWNGMSTMGSWIYNEIVGFVKSFIEKAVTDPLKILSPSRVMMGHGMNVAIGLAQGILGGAGAVAAASNAIAHAAASGLSSSAGSIGAGIGTVAAAVGSGTSGTTGGGGNVQLVLKIDSATIAQALLNPLQTAVLRGQKTGGQLTISLGS